MVKPLFLALHGMGDHTAESLKKEIADSLDAASAGFKSLGSKFSEKVTIVPIAYNDEWNEIRTRLSKHAGTFEDRLNGLPNCLDLVGVLTNFESTFSDDSFFYTHWLDVILYRSFFGEKVRVKVAKAILDNLIIAKSQSLPIHILGHSLGTSVLHDTLHKLFCREFTKAEVEEIGSHVNQVDPEENQFNSIFMVSNVSRIVGGGKSPYESVVRPGAGGICHQMVNTRHEIDPFTWPLPFEPPLDDTWVPKPDLDNKVFRDVKIRQVTQFNVHDLPHYLSNPDVYLDIFHTIFGLSFNPTSSEENQARKAYNSTSIHDGFENVKDAAIAARFNNVDSLLKLYQAGSLFLKKIKELIGQAKK